MPGPGLPRAQPRRWQPGVGYNLPVGEPGSEGYKLASFATLKALGDYFSIARTALEIRKNEIRALDWEISLTPDAAKAYRGDRAAMRDFGERQAKVKKFFSKPDPNYDFFSGFLYAAMEQVFVYDALSLYLCPTKARGRGTGVLGSGLDSLWLVDGSSIRPMMGLHGEKPRPPAVAFQQYEFGVPRADFMMMRDGRDLDDAGFTSDDLRGQWRGDQLLYLPYVPRADSPYGFSLIEQAIIPIMTGLRKQAYQLEFFSESTIPAVYISPGDSSMTPTQIRELQDALNALAGDIAWRYKVIVLPPGSKTMPQKDMQIVDQSDEWIATEVLMVLNINPMEVGVLPRVSTVASPFAAREMAQAQRSIHARTSTKPTLKYLTDIANLVIQQILGQKDLRFTFSGMEEEQDLAAMTDMKVKQVQSGFSSIDEARDALGIGPPWGTDETSGPVIFTAAGPLPLGEPGSDTASDKDVADPLTDAHAASQGADGATPAPPGGSSTPGGTNGSGGGKNPASGTSGRGRMNGPVTQRQRRRGGSLAPAHATGEGSPGHSGGPVAKAASAELEALARHLRKGREVSTWLPRHIPGHALAIISEDLGKGLTPDEAVGIARTLILGHQDYEVTAPKAAAPAGANPQQRQAQAARQALIQRYMALITQAFGPALAKAILALVKAFMAGTLAVTAAVLASMIADLVADALKGILPDAWTEAWVLGEAIAQALVDGTVPDLGRWKPGHPGTAEREASTDGALDYDLQALLAQWGIGTIASVSGTRLRQVSDLIAQAVREGWDAKRLAREIRDLLDFPGRAAMIARTEITRAVMAATLKTYRDAGVTSGVWRVHSQHPCARCLKAQASPPLPLGTRFPGVDVPAPPAHPSCQCSLDPASRQGGPVMSIKAMRQQVTLSGQQFWADEDEPHENAAGSGAPVRPHTADGRVVPYGAIGEDSHERLDVRWDGSGPEPGDRGVHGGDDAAQGGPRGTGTPATAWPSPHYMDGHWPQGGHGSQQAPATSIGAGSRGRPPNSVGKAADAAAKFLKDAPAADPAAVMKLMRENFPPKALGWVRKARWVGPVELPLDLVDFSSADRWAAHAQKAKVDQFARQLRAKEKVNAVIGTVKPGHNHVRIVDGHHRVMACKKLGWPVRAYIAFLPKAGNSPADRTYQQQFHAGDSPQNKSFTAGAGVSPGAVSGLVPFNLLGQGPSLDPASVHLRPAASPSRSCANCVMFAAPSACTLVKGPVSASEVCDRWEPEGPASAKSAAAGPYVAGLMVRAGDTGRVLMLQRSLDDDQDYAAGKWEPPGGHAEPGETLLQAALREFAEETGHPVPRGALTGSWDASNGIYRGFVLTVPSEDAVDIFGGRDQVWDPDDPKGDHTQAVAWFDPAEFAGNPSMRPEMATDLDRVLAALDGQTAGKSAETPIVSTVHHPLGHEGLWHTPDRHVSTVQQLPAYFQNTARALMRDQGMGEQEAIATAVNAVKEWAEGHAFGDKVKVTPEVQAAARRALAEWEQLRASHAG